MPNFDALFNKAQGIVSRVQKRATGTGDQTQAARAMFRGLDPTAQAAMAEQVRSEYGAKAWDDFQTAIGGNHAKRAK